MKNFNKQIQEKASLKLAILKRHPDYQTSFEKLKRNFQIDKNGLFSEICEDILFGEMGFSLDIAPTLSKAARNGVLFEILDPHKDIEDCQHSWLLLFMFCFPGIKEISRPDLNLFHRNDGPINPKDLKDYERLLNVDLRKPQEFLLREFEGFLNNIYARKKSIDIEYNIRDHCPKLSEETVMAFDLLHERERKAFKSWDADTTRARKEAWTQLKIWDLWKQGQGFKQIARELKLTYDSVKKAFRKAYERIYRKTYDPIDIWSIKYEKPNLNQFKKNCQKKPCENCNTPCSEFKEYIEAYISQDHVSQKDSSLTDMEAFI